MDQVFNQIKADIANAGGDNARQTQALIQVLQFAAQGRDISALTKTVCDDVINGSATAVCKRLAFDVIRSSRLTGDQWESVCRGMSASAFESFDPEVGAAAVSFLPALPSWRVGKFLDEFSKEITKVLQSEMQVVRHATVVAMGCLLARDDVAILCAGNVNMLDQVQRWWSQIASAMVDASNLVSAAAFEAVGRLLAEFRSKRLSRIAGDKLIQGESIVAVRAKFVGQQCVYVWDTRDVLMKRGRMLPMEMMRATVYPLVYAARVMATGMLNEMRVVGGEGIGGGDGTTSPRSTLDSNLHAGGKSILGLTTAGRSKAAGGGGGGKQSSIINTEIMLGVSDVVNHFIPFLSSLDPSLVYEVGINLLSLAGVPGGKAEWAASPITAFLSLWDRQDFTSGREAIVRAVVSNLNLLDLHLQVALFKRVLLMVRNLPVEADRMHALACVCRSALSVDLFARESVRRGQKPLSGTEVSSLFEDGKIRADIGFTVSGSLFREELVACLVETCFQLSRPPRGERDWEREGRVLGALSSGTGHEAMEWTHSALDVVEVCRHCIKWDCEGRTYAMDCYLRLLVRLCHLYDTSSGIKKEKDGGKPEEIVAHQKLVGLQRQLLDGLKDMTTPRMRVRVIWALAEHLDLDGLTPLMVDDPTDPLVGLIEQMHRLLFNLDSTAATATDRLQDVQTLLLCALHLGARSERAATLLTEEIEAFRNSNLADIVNKNQCRMILSVFNYVRKHPEARWTGRVTSTGDYPFSHHKLSVQFDDRTAAMDRKLEGIVKKAVGELWRPSPSELSFAMKLGSEGGSMAGSEPPPARPLSGSSDPCYLEAYHLPDVSERRLTLNMKILNMTEQELDRVDVRVGLMGSLSFIDSSPQAVRQLKNLISQDPMLFDITVCVSRFERCALAVHLIFYPQMGGRELREGDEEGGGGRSASSRFSKLRSGKWDEGDAVVLRCVPYRVPLTEMLLPQKASSVEFFRLWSSLPAATKHLGVYDHDPNDRLVLSGEEIGMPRFLSGLKALARKPLYRVCAHVMRTTMGFQVCYLSRTWFGDTLAMIVFGTNELTGDLGFKEDNTTMICRFMLRSSSERVLQEIDAELQEWLDDLTDGKLRAVTEEEISEEVEAKLKHEEGLAVVREEAIASSGPLKQPASPSDDESLIPGLLPVGSSKPSAAMDSSNEELKALQMSVLQEWETLRAMQRLS